MSRQARACTAVAAFRLIAGCTLALASSPAFAQTPAPAATSPTDTLRAALDRSVVAQDSTALAEALNGIGMRFWNAAVFDSAVVYLEQARAVWLARHDSVGLGRVYNNLGVTHFQWGHLSAALESHLRSVAVRSALGDARGTALALTNAGRTLKEMQLHARAESALTEAIQESDRAGDAFVRGYARYNLGLLRVAQGDAEGAREAFEESARVYREGGPTLTPAQSADGVAMNRVGLASILLLTGDPGGAIALLEEPLGSGGGSAASVRQAEALMALGKAYLANGAPGQAIRTFERALRLSREAGQRTREMEALRALSDTHESLGDVPTALRYARLHRVVRDVAAADWGVQEVLAVERRLAAEREAEEIARLREEGQAREALIARQRLGFTLGGMLLLAVAALVAVLIRSIGQRKRREILLRSANEALEGANRDLRVALSEVRTLEGLIPICARCKKVKDEGGYWDSVESYIASRSSALFSHGICDECGAELYGEDWVGAPPELDPLPRTGDEADVTAPTVGGPPRSP